MVIDFGNYLPSCIILSIPLFGFLQGLILQVNNQVFVKEILTLRIVSNFGKGIVTFHTVQVEHFPI